MAETGGVSDNSFNNQTNTTNKLLAQLIKAIGLIFPQSGAASSAATAGSATLPSAPAGFLAITLPNGTQGKVPYYNP